MIDQVMNNPAIPVHWGKNQAGMVADEESNALVMWEWEVSEHEGNSGYAAGTAEESWKYAASNAGLMAQAMHDAGYHKQIVNRLLEPFMWTKGIITADQKGWDSFFALRCHPDAQPEIQALAYEIRDVMEESTPRKLEYGQWHLPYVEAPELYCTKEFGSKVLEEYIKISTSCTAQVSYRRLDDSLEKAEKIYEMLNLPEGGEYKDDPPHFSPAEHVAKCVEDRLEIGNWSYSVAALSGNFNTNNFVQYRKALEVGIEKELIDGD